MLLYTLLTIIAGLLLASVVALRRLIRELRDRRESDQRMDSWADGGGPQRARFRVIDGGRGA